MRINGAIIAFLCVLMVSPVWAKWSDTEQVAASGVMGKADITLSEYAIEISPSELYPGFEGELQVAVTNVGKVKVDLLSVVSGCPDFVTVVTEFAPRQSLERGEQTNLIIRVSVNELETGHQEEAVNFTVSVTGQQQ